MLLSAVCLSLRWIHSVHVRFQDLIRRLTVVISASREAILASKWLIWPLASEATLASALVAAASLVLSSLISS